MLRFVAAWPELDANLGRVDSFALAVGMIVELEADDRARLQQHPFVVVVDVAIVAARILRQPRHFLAGNRHSAHAGAGGVTSRAAAVVDVVVVAVAAVTFLYQRSNR